MSQSTGATLRLGTKRRPRTFVRRPAPKRPFDSHAAPFRLVEIAELLGVTKQRAHQIADEPGFPAPAERDGRGRLWDRREVAA
jgi:hypothetical protein